MSNPRRIITTATVTLDLAELRQLRELVALEATYRAAADALDEARDLLRVQRKLRRAALNASCTIRCDTFGIVNTVTETQPRLELVGAP